MAINYGVMAWWAMVALGTAASGIDLYCRRIPNWLVLPFLIAGIGVHSAGGGVKAALGSFAGIGLAALFFGVPCLLGAMGMGDLKLAAAVGAWIGPGQFLMASVATGIIGGALAIGYAAFHGSLGESLSNASELLMNVAKLRRRPTAEVRQLQCSPRRSIPYAPAIAIGTLFSFFAS